YKHSPIKSCKSARLVKIYHLLINAISPCDDGISDLSRATDHDRHHWDGNSRDIHQLAEKTAWSRINRTCDLRQANGFKVRKREFECPKDCSQKKDDRLRNSKLAQRTNQFRIATRDNKGNGAEYHSCIAEDLGDRHNKTAITNRHSQRMIERDLHERPCWE